MPADPGEGLALGVGNLLSWRRRHYAYPPHAVPTLPTSAQRRAVAAAAEETAAAEKAGDVFTRLAAARATIFTSHALHPLLFSAAACSGVPAGWSTTRPHDCMSE